jgi:hypothetical protein
MKYDHKFNNFIFMNCNLIIHFDFLIFWFQCNMYLFNKIEFYLYTVSPLYSHLIGSAKIGDYIEVVTMLWLYKGFFI